MFHLKKTHLSILLAVIFVLSVVKVECGLLADLFVNTFTFSLDAGDVVTQELLPSRLPSQNETFDFIIVGAGPAGCVLANRLTENPKWSVLLLEAGGKANIAHDIPAMVSLLQLTNSNWGYKSVPQNKSCFGMYDNECSLPRGKLLSGTSGINFMIYNRGNARDFDRWAEAGNPGWSYEEVLPYFKRSEMAHLNGLENSPYHNTTGPLSVEFVSYRTSIANSFVEGAKQAGHVLTDYNGESQIGVSYVQATTKRGHRHTASKAYVDDILINRRNLKILTFAMVTKILIDPETKAAYGVEFVHKNIKRTIRARKEVIISAGAFNSPQLLMLSGVGPKDVLSSVGIPLIKELPVGKLMYDHMSFIGPVVTVNTTGQTLFASRLRAIDFLTFEAGSPSTRFSTIGGVESLVFLKTPNSSEPANLPDVELIMATTSFAGDYGTGLKEGANLRDEVYNKMFRPLIGRDHFTFLVMQFHPKSVGYLTLRDNNPFSPPIIDPNYFDVDEDIEVILQGVKEAVRIVETPAMQRIGAKLHDIPTPGCEQYEIFSDDYFRCSIKVLSYTLHHQVATCKMGPYDDPTSVVSAQLKVHDVKNLRVVDTGIIPMPPTAHTNAASFMIGEKAADMIKEEWLGQ